MTVSTETVRMANSRPRKNQSERSDLPCHIIKTVNISAPDEASDGTSNIVVPLPFKDQKSANSVKREMQNLSAKIGVQIKPVFQCKKSAKFSPRKR